MLKVNQKRLCERLEKLAEIGAVGDNGVSRF